MSSPSSSLLHRLGRVFITRHAQAVLSRQDVVEALQRHAQRAAGAVVRRHRRTQLRPLFAACRFLSADRASNGKPFWMITEANASRTTILLPEDFSNRRQ